jgi:hypothetical protein
MPALCDVVGRHVLHIEHEELLLSEASQIFQEIQEEFVMLIWEHPAYISASISLQEVEVIGLAIQHVL